MLYAILLIPLLDIHIFSIFFLSLTVTTHKRQQQGRASTADPVEHFLSMHKALDLIPSTT